MRDISSAKEEQLASISMELRNALADIANDDYICHAFSARDNSFTWEDLEENVIFLCIPAEKIDAWGKTIALMYKQLFRYLERRPEKYSQKGRNREQILLLMDEFPRFGRIEGMASAMATLRSKGVTICLMIQSLAQLDELYGENGRRIILDNCPYKAILSANDPDTQKYLSDLAGTIPSLQWGASVNLNRKFRITGYGGQINSSEKPFIQPHKLAFLEDVLLITPHGVYQIGKIPPTHLEHPSTIHDFAQRMFFPHKVAKIPEEVTMMSIESIEARKKQADEKARSAEQSKRKKLQENDKRRNHLIGEIFTKRFPSVKSLEPGSGAHNEREFAELEAFLYLLSLETELLVDLEARAKDLVATDPNGDWRNSPPAETSPSICEESTYTSEEDLDQERSLSR